MAQPANIISAADRERVNEAVRAAELKTSAEIVPVVAKSSGRYDRAEDIVGLWMAGVVITLVWIFFPLPSTESGDWSGLHPVWQLVAVLAGGLAGFVGGAVLGTFVNPLRRLFAAKSQMAEEVAARSRQMFFDSSVHHTGGGSGVLLYISMFEHMSAVVADQGVLEKLGQEKIDAICRDFTTRLHDGTPADALCETIAGLGETLAPLLPRGDDDVNQLPDELVVIE